MSFNTILNQPAFVIHIEKLSPNRTAFKKNISEAGFTNMTIFEGVNGDYEIENCVKEFDNVKFHKYLGRGQKGCLCSHIKLYKHIITNNIQLCTIFEDDVHFHPHWKNLRQGCFDNTPKDFDIIFIGNQIDACKTQNRIPVVNTQSCFCTHAYIITLKGATRLLDYILNWDFNSDRIPAIVGHTITGLMPIDIIIKDMQDSTNNGRIKKDIVFYCWNGTRFPCDFNRLPLKGNDFRNTGLVFQSDDFVSVVSEKIKENL